MKQEIIIVDTATGYYRNEINTGFLETKLKKGWRVITATPVLRNNGGCSYTDKIIYILEVEEDKDE